MPACPEKAGAGQPYGAGAVVDQQEFLVVAGDGNFAYTHALLAAAPLGGRLLEVVLRRHVCTSHD